MNEFLTRPVVTALSFICAGLAVWMGAEINLGASSAFRLILTTVVLLAAAVALWLLRPEDDGRAPRPPYQRGPSLRDRLAALTQPAPLPHRPARYPGHGANGYGAPESARYPQAPTSYPEPTPYPQAPTPEPPAPELDFDSLFNRRKGGE